MKQKVVSFLVSGRGSNFKAIAEKIIAGEINAELGILISSTKDAKALDIANGFKMESFFIDPASFASRKDHEKAMVNLLKKYNTDLIVTAGYMRVLTPFFVKEYRNKIMNIHPALLPSFPGTNAQKQAFDKGVKMTGCTTHFIDEGTDTGPIIMQAAVPVLENDTIESLSARILKEEHRIFPESVKLFCYDRLTIIGNKVLIKSLQ
ncbi:MAG: phosphoribosylglycinamide formyltransferase [Spirochaetes bacterium]|nr:phosphoribosylglycinamide formyltransferase [Spirochaetota bacterium]